MRDAGTRIVTLESQTPVADFDVIAFSVSFEWDYTNVLTMLRLAGVPLRAADRDYTHPLVVIGGAVTFVNPEPLAMFADVIAAGEGEVARARAGRRVRHLVPPRTAAAPRAGARLLRAVVLRRRVRRRRHHRALRAARRDGCAAGGSQGGAEKHRRRRSAVDHDLHSRYRVRLALPRSKWCAAARTCAGSAGPATTTCRSAPSRPSRILELAQPARAHSSRAGLVSIALCDHPEIEHILRSLKDMGYSISPASLRLDDLTPTIVSLLKESGERTLTIAPETGSDRLRRVINKTVTNEEILDRAELIFSTGIESLKLYYMIGLPTEDGRRPGRHSRSDPAAARDHAEARPRARPHRPHRGQRQSAGAEAGHRLSMAADGTDRRHRAQDEADALARGRHRQRLLQHQERAALLLPGAAVARRSAHRAGDRAGRGQRRPVAQGRWPTPASTATSTSTAIARTTPCCRGASSTAA